jgi:hypothetical protein
MSMKLKLSPKFSFGLAAVLFSFVIKAASQEAPDPSRIVASIYDGSLKTHGAVGALWLDSRDRQATLSKALKTLWDKADAAAKSRHDEVGPIDWDVTTNSQGMTVKSFALMTEKKDATRATVVAALVPDNWVRASPDENIIGRSMKLAPQAASAEIR